MACSSPHRGITPLSIPSNVLELIFLRSETGCWETRDQSNWRKLFFFWDWKRCKVWRDMSSFWPVNSGVRQGCVLAPLLFDPCIDWVVDRVIIHDSNMVMVVIASRAMIKCTQVELACFLMAARLIKMTGMVISKSRDKC